MGVDMDYSRHLVLYSGGADSTYFIAKEPTARHLLHFRSTNSVQTQHAQVSALEYDRYLSIVATRSESLDGEINQIHALNDSLMALEASIMAARYGMKGIVVCFNSDDIGIDTEALKAVMHRAEPAFEILTPLRGIRPHEIRSYLREQGIRYVSCMRAGACAECMKCRREAAYVEAADQSLVTA
jgi:7-cyano-7-deazaguanine synthase in queuosine biosynthesis